VQVTAEIQAASLRLYELTTNDPYSWCCGLTVSPLEPRVAILGPTLSAPPLDALPLIARALADLGFTETVWERTSARGVRWVRFPLSRWLRRPKPGGGSGAQ